MKSNQVGRAGVGVRKLAFRKYYVPILLALVVLAMTWTLIGGFVSIIVTFAALIFISSMGKNVDRAVRGAVAEEKIASELTKLPDGYTVFNDILFRYGSGKHEVANIDHVVVGPAGVFIVETKSHKGKVTLSADQQLLLNGRAFEKKFIGQVYGQINTLKEKLVNGDKSPYVTGIIVFTNASVKVRNPVKSLYIMNKGYLVKFFAQQEQKRSISEVEVQRIKRVLLGMMGERAS